MQPITTTLKAIRKAVPCGLHPEKDGTLTGYSKLKAFLGENWQDNQPILFSQIIESNGVADAYWCTKVLGVEHEPVLYRISADCAESVLHLFEKEYPNEPAPRNAIQASRDYADGKISKEELRIAEAAARAAWVAAGAVAGVVAAEAAWAAWAAALAAADEAAEAVVDAAVDAAWTAAERKKQAAILLKHLGE
jgi:hypothetical protein